MQPLKQIDCFNIHLKLWRYLGIWLGDNPSLYRSTYSKFLIAFIILHNLMSLFNIYFVPLKLDVFIGEMLFYFTEISSTFKFMAIYILSDKIKNLFAILESDIFQPDTKYGTDILDAAKNFVRRYWKIVTIFSLICHAVHILSPVKDHVFYSEPLVLPTSQYYFLSEEFKETYIYILYVFQTLGIDCVMWHHLNVDTFIVGLFVLIIAQIEILDMKLRTITDIVIDEADAEDRNDAEIENESIMKLKECVIHFLEVEKFCELTQEAFSFALFVQFSISSIIICVCVFRFTMPASSEYYIFIVGYIFVVIMEILAPCWFGTRVAYKSKLLPLAVYNCDWTPRSRRFKSSLRIFAERTSRPLAITAGKMFPISLTTFTSIMNSAYSFYTLLRHMQSREA